MRLATSSLAATLALAALASPRAWAQEGATWLPGDTWTWLRDGSIPMELSAVVQAASGGGFRTMEVERSAGPAGGNISEAQVVRLWPAPLLLASEERLEHRCVDLLLERACGNRTEARTYKPPLELVRFPLADGLAWTQDVSVRTVLNDELAQLSSDSEAPEKRFFRAQGPVNASTPKGAFEGWLVTMDTEAQDSDGTREEWVYSAEAQQLVVRRAFLGGQEQGAWKLSGINLQPRASAPATSPPPGSAPPRDTSGSGAGGKSSPFAEDSGGNASAPSYGPGASRPAEEGPKSTAAPPPGDAGTASGAEPATGEANVEQRAERPLKVPVAPAAALLLLLAPLARALRRRG